MKDWVVVHFLEEETVEAVPASWYNMDTKQCSWPAKASKKIIADIIRKREEPSDEWQTFSAKLLGRYDSYEVAEKKALKAQRYSDLSSATESITLKKKRRIIKPRKYSPSKVQADTASDGSSEDSSEVYVKPPAKRRSINKENEKINFCNQPITSGVSTEVNNFAKTSEIENKEFQREVLTQLNIISAKLSGHGEMLNLLIKDKNATYNTRLSNNVGVDKILTLLPLENLNSLKEVEDLLKDGDGTFDALTQELSRLGGAEVKALVKKIMYRILSNELGQLFSWDGAKGKKAFKTLNIAQVVLRAARINPRTQGEDEDVAIFAIKSWLVRAKDRQNNSLKRASREKSTDLNLSLSTVVEENVSQ